VSWSRRRASSIATSAGARHTVGFESLQSSPPQSASTWNRHRCPATVRLAHAGQAEVPDSAEVAVRAGLLSGKRLMHASADAPQISVVQVAHRRTARPRPGRELHRSRRRAHCMHRPRRTDERSGLVAVTGADRPAIAVGIGEDIRVEETASESHGITCPDGAVGAEGSPLGCDPDPTSVPGVYCPPKPAHRRSFWYLSRPPRGRSSPRAGRPPCRPAATCRSPGCTSRHWRARSSEGRLRAGQIDPPQTIMRLPVQTAV